MSGIGQTISVLGLSMLILPIALGVPARNSQTCSFPSTWLDIWLEPGSNTTVSILHNSFAEKGGCVLRLEGTKDIKSFILRSSRKTCFRCVHIQELHSNVLRYKMSECNVQRHVARLCGAADVQPFSYLYRDSPLDSTCPPILSGSHSLQYSEYSPTSDHYSQDCGEPRSESNTCRQRSKDDPQLSINYGNCPSGTLVHRTSMTQTLTCVGSWQEEGVLYMVGRGEVWEYWEPGDYKNSGNSYICMALETDGLKLYLSQGFGSGCDGLGGRLTPYNGLRNLVMEKRFRLEESCQFPDWLVGPQKWQIIPQSGSSFSRSGPKDLLFNSASSFQMSSGDGGFPQEFSCSKRLKESSTELQVQIFSQSQCLGEYHCLHAKFSPNSNTVTIHLGAPTPHIEHSCVPPSFDEFVPYLKATLVPSGGVLPVLERFQGRDEKIVESTTTEEYSQVLSSGTVEAIERNTLSQIHSYHNRFMQEVEMAVQEMARKLKKCKTKK